MVRRTAWLSPLRLLWCVVELRWLFGLGGARRDQRFVWMGQRFFPRLSIWKVLVTGCVVGRFSNVQPTMGACETSGGSCCPYDGLCLLNIDSGGGSATCCEIPGAGISCLYRVASLGFSSLGPLTSINRAVDHGIVRSTTPNAGQNLKLLP